MKNLSTTAVLFLLASGVVCGQQRLKSKSLYSPTNQLQDSITYHYSAGNPTIYQNTEFRIYTSTYLKNISYLHPVKNPFLDIQPVIKADTIISIPKATKIIYTYAPSPLRLVTLKEEFKSLNDATPDLFTVYRYNPSAFLDTMYVLVRKAGTQIFDSAGKRFIGYDSLNKIIYDRYFTKISATSNQFKVNKNFYSYDSLGFISDIKTLDFDSNVYTIWTSKFRIVYKIFCL